MEYIGQQKHHLKCHFPQKVRYRCNTWKRTKCGFQMFTFATTNTGIIDLYESGEHDHSGRQEEMGMMTKQLDFRRKLEYDLYGPIRRRNNQNNQGKGELDEEISGGRNSNLASEIGEGSVEKRLQETPSTSSEPIGTTFSLAEADKNEKLFEMATKFGLTMTVEKYLKGETNHSQIPFPAATFIPSFTMVKLCSIWWNRRIQFQ